ncbi:MAG: DUF4129 domain-containing protein [Proteobacteria bacterium]|nr:DUF4129 domain-containing protein [Pseudomonadota bacterium]
MKPPPFLMAAALLLWGWQTGLLAIALLMAVVLEAARWIEWRVDFSVKDFNRVVDLVSLLAAAGAIYCTVTRETTNQVMAMFQSTNFAMQSKAATSMSQTAFIYFQWFPMILFPVIAALGYSTSEQIPRSCFFMLTRRRAARSGLPQPVKPGINLLYPYFAVVLFAACLANQRSDWFYFAICGLVAVALWVTRPRRFSNVVWVVVLFLVIKGGFWGYHGLNQLQGVIENKLANWVAKWARRSLDRSDTATAIGRIGQLKLSGKIVMQVEPENGPVPQLLRDTMFNRFDSPRWSHSPRPEPTEVLASEDGTVWPLLERPATNSVLISSFSTRGEAVLALPPGTVTLFNISAEKVTTNRAEVVRVSKGPDFLRVRALYGPGPTLGDAAITNGPAQDLTVPLREQEIVAQVAQELALTNHPPEMVARKLIAFFNEQFKYGSFLPDSLAQVPHGMTPLGFFLTKNRIGHCEYFATATVLLMRQAGIPARYVYGWSVQEPEKGTNRFIVRERHAHAWCVYWDAAHKTWVDLDTTSADWAETEKQNASFWEPLSDRWSRAWFAYSKWRWYGGAEAWQNYFLIALIVLIALLAWRILARQRRKRRGDMSAANPAFIGPGLDSEFYRIESRLETLGLGRRPGEAISDWLERIQPLATLPLTPLRQLLWLHYRLRFDPQGLRAEERDSLRNGVNSWLAESQSNTKS